jgi:putative hydrolase of the HAD superfamily
MIKNVVFDVGRVLVGYNPQKILDGIVPDSVYHSVYQAHLFDAEIWQLMDRGVVSHDEAIELLSHHGDHDPVYIEGMRRLLGEFSHHLEILPESRQLFMDVKKKYPVYILSNFQADPFDQLVDLHPFMQSADGMVVSAKVKMMKPDKEIYHHLLETHELVPQETVFIDDLHENIVACEAVNMHGIVFKSAAQARRDLLERFGVVV